jgi:DNA helicase II / ATP-dependent DNA helicase PcrA
MKTYKLKERQRSSEEELQRYKDTLTPMQHRAASHLQGPHLVIAGAGTGKTRTLIYRVAYLIESGVAPESILLLTFTRRAAHEMMRRAAHILDARCERIHGGTFHSFANNVLRRYASLLGYSTAFSIIDRSDAEDVVGLIRTEKAENDKKTRFPKKHALLSLFSKVQNTGLSVGQILKADYPQFSKLEKEIQSCLKEFCDYKKHRNLMDYDDLLVNLRQLVRTEEKVTKELAERYRYILIDEYQDTNSLQADIACALAQDHRNIFVVGDDAQSIYSFRGANFQNIMEFPHLFPDSVVTKLEENFRSSQPILDFTNAVISCAKERYVKELFAHESQRGVQKPIMIRPQTTSEQSDFVAQRILDLRESGTPLNEIAVLFRSGWHANELEVVFSDYGIPYVKYGGLRFMETAHIKDAVSFLRIVQNPLDVVAWSRILQLHKGIGPKTTHSIIEEVQRVQNAQQALREVTKDDKRARQSLDQLLALLESLESARTEVAQLTRHVAEYYIPVLKENYDDYIQRVDDIESLVSISERYASLEQFLDDLAIDPPEESQIEADGSQPEEGKVVLSTVHSAKGLEWRLVFVINLLDGYFPSTHALYSTADCEEERRLLYVACTRAKEELYLLMPHLTQRSSHLGGGGVVFSEPSRFLRDIGKLEELVEEWKLS